MNLGDGGVRQIRVGRQSGNKVRVVLDLGEASRYEPLR
ncbi:MAG: AMIN domain-containing protein [Syntrophotaleaceae bacterium]